MRRWKCGAAQLDDDGGRTRKSKQNSKLKTSDRSPICSAAISRPDPWGWHCYYVPIRCTATGARSHRCPLDRMHVLHKTPTLDRPVVHCLCCHIPPLTPHATAQRSTTQHSASTYT